MSDTKGRLGRIGMRTGVAWKTSPAYMLAGLSKRLLLPATGVFFYVGIVSGFSLEKKDRRLTVI
jgi:hypothetical protein